MRRFLVENLSDRPVKLGVEPWAEIEILAPNDRVLFECEEHLEPAKIEFSIMGDDSISVGIVSDVVKIKGNNGEKIFRC